MRKASLIIAIVALVPILTLGTAHAADLSNKDLLNSLAIAAGDEQRAGFIGQLQDRDGDDIRIALEGISADNTETSMIRMQALCALAQSATSESVPMSLEIVEQDLIDRHGFWACAIPLLGALKDRRAVPLLLRVGDLQEDHLAGMDHMAIIALSKMANQNEVAFLEGKSHIFPVRTDVMLALSRIAAPSSAAILVSGLQGGESGEITKAATSGLTRIGGLAVPALEAGLENRPDEVMKSRISALIRAIK
jgi:hypothetical protein